MRTIEYLSPTSIATFEEDPERFYHNYLSENRPPRDPQTKPMAIGSAFDAYVKNYLHEKLYGKDHDSRYELDTLLRAQVEPHNLDWAKQHGEYVFEQYRSSGALADIMLELNSGSDQRFEFDVRGVISGYREGTTEVISGVTLLGKPDVSFVTKEGVHVNLDFKVNGYMSRASPAPGYIKLRSAGRTNYGKHKDAFLDRTGGLEYNCATPLNVVKKDWAAQLSIYSWLCGQPVGGDFIVGIEQIACVGNPVGLPAVKCATHRSKVSPEFQQKLFSRICEIWDIVRSDWIFRDMSREDSIARCELLDTMSSIVVDDNWLGALGRQR